MSVKRSFAIVLLIFSLSTTNDLTQTSVVVVLYFLILVWLLASYIGVQRSLQWWCQRQAALLSEEAEDIRDGLLQDSFAMRRSLELAIAGEVDSSQKADQTWLKQIETIQQSLEELSNRLSPPYLEDSLPLAVRWLLEQWQTKYSNLTAKVTLPPHWQNGRIEQSRIVLTTLNELLRLTLSHQVLPLSVQASFRQQRQFQELMLQLSRPTTIALSVELESLRQTFQVLTSGSCYCQKNGSTVTWYFRWRSRC